jgi:hypothetical protein
MPQLQSQTFTAPRTPAEAPLVTQLNQFFTDNPSITLLTMQTSNKEGATRGESLVVSLTFLTGEQVLEKLPGGVKYYVAEFLTTLSQPADAQATAFFAANPNFLPIFSFVLQNAETRYTAQLRIMVVYQTADFLSATHASLSLTGLATVSVPPQLRGTVLDGTDINRATLPDTFNLSTQPWYRSGEALVVKSLNAEGLAAYAAVGPNRFTPSMPPPVPVPPVPPEAPGRCNCCYKLVTFDYSRGEARCAHLVGTLVPDFNTCLRGDPTDIMKALVKGYVEAPDCGCGLVPKWVWPDPLHYYFSPQTQYENGFWAVVGFEDLGPGCADFDYNDSVWVLALERCDGLDSPCATAPPNPATPAFPGY